MVELGVEKVFIEKMSGKNTERPELKKMLSYMREGDTLVVESVSRLSRSIRDLLSIVDRLEKMGVIFVSQKEAIDTSSPQGRFVLAIFGALSELEREQTLQRQREGIELAKAAGKYRGRRPIPVDEDKFARLYKKWLAKEITAVEFGRRMGLKAKTLYRRIRAYEATS